MSRYLVHRMKDAPQESFRWASHTGGETVLKPKDFEPGPIVEAATPYAAWKHLQAEGEPLRPGDVLEEDTRQESPEPRLLILKYIGFEPAQWFVPEARLERQVYETGAVAPET